MPQMKAKKNFFLIQASKISPQSQAKSSQTIAVNRFQELQKNIAGGEA